MLPRRHRLRSSREFARTIRKGRRARTGSLVGYLDAPAGAQPARVGLVVSRQVGGSVDRHRVSRVLRHGIAAHVDRLPAGSVLVVRALPGAAQRNRKLAADVAALLDRLTRAS